MVVLFFILFFIVNISYAQSEIGTIIEKEHQAEIYKIVLVSKRENGYAYITRSPRESIYSEVNKEINFIDDNKYTFTLLDQNQLIKLNSFFGITENLSELLEFANIDTNTAYWMDKSTDESIPAVNIETLGNNNITSSDIDENLQLYSLYYLEAIEPPQELNVVLNNTQDDIYPPQIDPVSTGEVSDKQFEPKQLDLNEDDNIGHIIVLNSDDNSTVLEKYTYNKFYITKNKEPIFFIDQIIENPVGQYRPTLRFDGLDVDYTDRIDETHEEIDTSTDDLVYTGNIISIEYSNGSLREDISFDYFEIKNGELLIYATTSQ